MILLGALVLLTGAWLLVQVLVAELMGHRAQVIQLGMGPSLELTKWGETELRLGIIPAGGFVKFDPEQVAVFSFARFSVLNLLPWVVLGGLALVAGAAVEDFVEGFTLIARAPEVVQHWASWGEALRGAPLSSLARVEARIVSINLLPLAATAGGQVISRMLPERARAVFNVGSLLLFVGLVMFGFLR